MKELGAAKQIIGMRIKRTREDIESHKEYVKKVLQHFNIEDAMSVSTPLTSHFKLHTKERSLVTGRADVHGQDLICFVHQKLEVCNGVYEAGYCSCSGSCK
jgi:hypothetical protein